MTQYFRAAGSHERTLWTKKNRQNLLNSEQESCILSHLKARTTSSEDLSYIQTYHLREIGPRLEK